MGQGTTAQPRNTHTSLSFCQDLGRLSSRPARAVETDTFFCTEDRARRHPATFLRSSSRGIRGRTHADTADVSYSWRLPNISDNNYSPLIDPEAYALNCQPWSLKCIPIQYKLPIFHSARLITYRATLSGRLGLLYRSQYGFNIHTLRVHGVMDPSSYKRCRSNLLVRICSIGYKMAQTWRKSAVTNMQIYSITQTATCRPKPHGSVTAIDTGSL